MPTLWCKDDGRSVKFMKEYIIKVDEDKKDIMGNCPLVEKPKELIRCKDCKYASKHSSYSVFGKPLYVCNHVRQIGREGLAIHTEDWFCADGERAVKWE